MAPEGGPRPVAVLEMRSSLPGLREGEEVLARWAEEGWYYRGVIKQDCGDFSCFVEDSCGDLERIWREDIIAETDDADKQIKARDAVIALHPTYVFSYCPAVILDVDDDLSASVRFYDGTETRLPREEVYVTSPEKFDLDVQYILFCEEQWVGQAVVARNDNTGAFSLVMVKQRIGSSRQYALEWSDDSVTVQTAVHIFGAFSKRHGITAGNHVLAVARHDTLTYLPGVVKSVGQEGATVKFCDGTQSEGIPPTQCFWLARDYYENAVSFYRSKQ